MKAESIRQFNEAQKDSKEQFEKAQEKSIWALRLALFSIIASIITSILVAIYVPVTIDRSQFEKVNKEQKDILNKLEEINLNSKPDTTLFVIQDQLEDISTTLKNVGNKLAKPTQNKIK